MSKKLIFLSGGGTLGPVTPLLALAKKWKRQNDLVEFAWVGTYKGPEIKLVSKTGMNYFALSVPKLDRYKFWMWITILPHLFFSCVKAFILLKKEKPDMVITAGGYVSVPLVWMAWLLRIPSWVHQLDIIPGIANKIMAPFASGVSVTWTESRKGFKKEKTIVTGGIVLNTEHGNAENMELKYKMNRKKPTVLVTGGGTGSESINRSMAIIAREIVSFVNVIHLTGLGKMIDELKKIDGYHVEEFLTDEMKDAYAVADFVVSRAGMGTILDLVSLEKPTLLIPIKNSHQEKNAKVLLNKNAVRVIFDLSPQLLKQEILRLAKDENLRNELSVNIKKSLSINGAEVLIDKLEDVLQIEI